MSDDINVKGASNGIFRLPKNIRQIGKGEESRKIFIEDYALTFAKQMFKEADEKEEIAILLGKNVEIEGCNNIFIQGILKLKDTEINIGEDLTNEIWTSLYEDIKIYFENLEIIGWLLSASTHTLENKSEIKKTHRNNFPGRDKVLFTYDYMDEKKTFHIYEDGVLKEQSGYYIYYERNEPMQTYMIDCKENELIEELVIEDKITGDMRERMRKKKKIRENASPGFMHVATTLMAVVVVIIGGALLHNYEQMKLIEKSLDFLMENVKEVGSLGNSSDQTDSILNENEKKEDLEVIILPGEVSEVDIENNPDDLTPEPTEEPKKSEKPKEPEKKKEPEKPKVKKDDKPAEQVKRYEVKKGDTLAGISYKLYNTAKKVEAIEKMNNLESKDVIIEGQILIVP